MPVTLTTLQDRTRVLLRDKKTRPDGTVVTPFWDDTELTSAINAAVTNRMGLVESLFKTFYQTTKTYTGVTDAIASTNNEQYKLPGFEGDSSTAFRLWIIMRRGELETAPVVLKVEPEMQEPITANSVGLFDGLYAAYPENLAPATQTVAIISGTRIRIKPAPADNLELFKLWYKRFPVAMSAGGNNMDSPDSFAELICHDAAVELKEIVNAAAANALKGKREGVLADLLANHTVDNGPGIFGNVRI